MQGTFNKYWEIVGANKILATWYQICYTCIPYIFINFLLQIIFLETICNDERIIERNIRLKIQQSPDYAEEYGCRVEKHSSILLDDDLHSNYWSFAGQTLKLEWETLKTD